MPPASLAHCIWAKSPPLHTTLPVPTPQPQPLGHPLLCLLSSSPLRGLAAQCLHPTSPARKPSWVSHCQLKIIMVKTGCPLQVLPTLLQWMGNSKSFFPILQTPNFSTAFCSFPLLGILPHVSLYAQSWLFLASLHFTFATSLPSSQSRTWPSIWADLLFPSCCLGPTTLMPFAGCEHFYHSQLSHPPSSGTLRCPAALLPKQKSLWVLGCRAQISTCILSLPYATQEHSSKLLCVLPPAWELGSFLRMAALCTLVVVRTAVFLYLLLSLYPHEFTEVSWP